MNRFKYLPHPEERPAGPRLEGWAAGKVLVPTLRDASLRDAPQGEVTPQSLTSRFDPFVTSCFDCIHFESDSEEHRIPASDAGLAMRLEGCGPAFSLPTLRDGRCAASSG